MSAALCQVQRCALEVPGVAVAKARRLYAELGPSREPLQIATDIWVSGEEIRGHYDKTAEGKVTYGVLLCAEGYRPRLGYLTGNARREYDVEAGSAFVLDAREYHDLSFQVGRDGLVAFLAWDLPHDFTLQGFARRAARRLRHWGDSTEPFTQPGAGI